MTSLHCEGFARPAPRENCKTNEKARTAGNGRASENATQTSLECILPRLIDSINTRLHAGETITASDFQDSERAHYQAAIAHLRDRLPIRCFWRTKTESLVGDWRIRQKCYRLSAEFLAQPGGY